MFTLHYYCQEEVDHREDDNVNVDELVAKAENDFFEILEQERKRREREEAKRQRGEFNDDEEKHDEGKVSEGIMVKRGHDMTWVL